MCYYTVVTTVPTPPPMLSLSDPSSFHQPDESVIDHLLISETHFCPQPDYLLRCRNRSIDTTARQDSINWILKVHSHYHFIPVTALLSVNYFDRFLSLVSIPVNGWAFQLLSVACLSLAAKMEEPYVPLLLDLQIMVPRFVFDPTTVQRMELLVMSNLNWRLRSVTPYDYLDYFIFKLQPDPITHLLSASSDLILNATRVIDFLGFSPSIIAAAAVLCAAGDDVDVPESFYEKVNKEMVRSCHQLMEEYLIDTCPSADHKHLRAEPQLPPPSPDGILDAAASCVSCDSEPSKKRLRSSVQ